MSALSLRSSPAEAGSETAAGAAGGPRHFLELDAIPAAELKRIVAEGLARKRARAGLPKGASDAAAPGLSAPLEGHTLAMVFEKPSTRTRVSFDMAMRQLGGDTLVLNAADLQLGRGETVADTARVLSGYVDAIMLRTFAPETLDEMAGHSSAPVINGLTNRSHPCQIMADILTFEELRGSIAGATVAWLGDGNNVAATFIQAAAQFDFELRLGCPPSLAPDPAIVQAAEARGARVRVTDDAAAAAETADLLVTDVWLSMNDDAETRAARHAALAPYQIDAALMAQARADALFMHCLPAHRGEEATAEVMDGPQSVIFLEAENRLHAQKGVLLWCLEKL